MIYGIITLASAAKLILVPTSQFAFSQPFALSSSAAVQDDDPG